MHVYHGCVTVSKNTWKNNDNNDFGSINVVCPAEAVVVVQAARFCKEMGLNNVILEGDASAIIAALRETEPNASRYGHLIEEARMILNSLPI
jgi:rhodanese-related sulfurtransferase